MMTNNLLERYKACLLLSAVGDSLGYRNGIWQFNSSGKDIQKEFDERFHRIENIRFELPQWRVSDDTILHLAVGQVLIEHGEKDPSSLLYSRMVKKFKSIGNELKTRHPSSNTMTAINRLSENDWSIPYSSVSHDCTAAVRSMVIGLRYSHPSELNKLIEVSIEISRMTHTHPFGYLSGFASALFTSFAVQNKPIRKWIQSLLEILPDVRKHLQSENRSDLSQSMKHWSSFEGFWKDFSKHQETNIENVEERDEFYRQFSHAGWSGASGPDSIAIALNSLLTSNGSWEDLCKRAALHGGHGDATGCIAGSFFGIIYGFDHVTKENYQNIEFHDELENVARKLFEISQKPPQRKENLSSAMDQRGPCVHFTFVPSDILDNMPAFRQWLSNNSSKSSNVLSKLVFPNLKIN